MAAFLLRRRERIGNKNDVFCSLVTQQKFEQIGMYVDTVGDYFARHFRVNEHSTDSSGVALLDLAHRIEPMCRMENTGLHAFHHVAVRRFGMTGLKHAT